MRIEFRRRKAGVRYCARVAAEHQVISRRAWDKRMMDAVKRVEKVGNRPGNIDDWEEATQARLNFAHIWYRHKLRYDNVSWQDVQAYIVMTNI